MAAHANITRRSVFRGLPLAAMAASLPALSTNALADAELLSLGEEFDRLWAEEIAAKPADPHVVGADWTAWDAAYDKTDALAKRIAGYRAHSIEGLRLKARVVNWCHDGKYDGIEADALDCRVTSDIVRDLLSLVQSA